MAQMLLPVLMLAGTGMSVFGQLQQGKAQEKAAKYEAQQMDANAKQVEASGQHAAIEQRRQSELLQSRAQAVAGATGFGMVDPDVLKIIGGITEEGERAFQSELFNSRSQANQMKAQAGATRYEGAQVRRATRIGAAATALSGVADAASGYKFFGQSNPGLSMTDLTKPGGRSTGFN